MQESIEYIEKQESSKLAKNGQDFLDDFIKTISGLGSQPIKMTANVNNADKLMESIKNGTYSSKVKSEESKVMESIRNGTYNHGSKGDKLMQDIKNGTVDFVRNKYD